jgi:N-acetylglucosaminyldiphosphoundecaprenol N-acetyl-beta-D-mannosaminyltransferase
VRIRGVRIDALPLDEAVARAHGWIEECTRGAVCFANVHVVETARHDVDLAAALTKAELVLPDGAPIAWALSMRSRKRVRRVTGDDFFDAFCASSAGPVRHFFIGSSPENLADLTERTRKRFPGLTICGTLAPPFGSLAELTTPEVADRIAAERPDVVWVGLGAPKQERWMAWAQEHLDVPVLAGIGAVFEFRSGARRRAPRMVQALGLEWAFRVAQEPRRLAHRYATTNASFLLGVCRDAVRR